MTKNTRSLIVLIFSALLFNMSFGQKKTTQNINYKRVVIQNSQQHLDALHHSGIDMSCGAIIKNNSVTIEANEYQLQLLQDNSVPYTILEDDLEEFYRQRAVADLPNARAQLAQMKAVSSTKSFSISEVINNVGQYEGCDEIDWAIPANFNLNPNNSPNSFGGCLTYDMILQELDDMRAQYPNLISVKQNASPSNQLTVEGRTVWFVRISDNPDIDEPQEPETLYQSLIHARESASVMQLMYYMWYILENYDSDPAIRNLVNNQAMYFIPVFNPDGFVYNQTQAPDGGGMQRKNRNTSAPGSCSQFLDGIDLNRNSAYYWGNGGSSTNSCSDTYMGTAPFSENETQIMRDFFLQHDFELALNHHSFKNAMLHAYAGTNNANPRPDEYSKYNHDMTFYNRYAYGPSTSISSLNSGNMNDWMLGGPAGTSANGTPTGVGSGKHTLAWTPENGLGSEAPSTGFWPFPSNFVPIAKRAMRMNFMAAYFSGKYAKLHDLNQTDISNLTGNFNFAIENLGQTASDFTLTITPISSNIVSVGSPVTVSGMSILQQNNVAINYELNSAIQADDEIEFKVVLTNDYVSDNVLYEANIVKRFSPTVLLADNPDIQNLTNWTSSGGSWFTTADAYSGSTAITSTNGSYSNGESKRLQLNTTLDLSSASSTVVQYYAKWDLERSFDYVQLEGSVNGTNWTPLCGRLTKPGAPDANNSYSQKSNSNNNFQPDGQPLYDGDTQDKWYMEEVVIDANNNAFLHNQGTVYLRFDFRSDTTNREDSYVNVDFEGFSFDDFKVTSIQVPCVLTIPSNVVVSGITESEATVTWDAITSANYDLRYREVGTTSWNNISDLNTTNYVLTGLNVLTDYEVQVRSKCGVNPSNYSTEVSFTTLDVQLNYCDSASTNVSDEYISGVTLNTIDNTSGAQFYSDFTNISTTLTKGEQYGISITPTWTGTIYNEAYSVWIDYNRDGDFNDPGEQVWTQSPTTNTPVNGNFTIPANAVENSTRMRVSMKYNDIPNPCETFTYGEVEDYTVIIESDTPDTTAPIITLNGATPINLELGSAYSELGASATDDIDGDITANIVIGGDVVDVNTVGTYMITYNVSDAAGNAATEVTRTVNITPDVTIPVITLNGASSINLFVGDTYNEQSATAMDNIDGDISGNIIIGGAVVNTNVAGTYVITYNVSDAAGNPAVEVTRTVIVEADTTIPVITLNGTSTINLFVGDTYNEQSATAMDNIDGDISGNIIIGGDVINTSVAGTYVVTYNVSDAAGNSAVEVTRTVIVEADTTIPVITLNGASTINLSVGETYTELGATALDNLDGDITSEIVIGGTVNTNLPGVYLITYNVTDNAGNAAVEVSRNVIVEADTTAPIISLIGNANISILVGGIYTEQGATATDNIDGDITGNIVIGGIVNTNIPNTYVVTYNVSDAAGNAATEVTRTVTILPDTTAPVMTLNGASTINLLVGDNYTELGANAIDNVDGDLSGDVIIGGAIVNVNTANTYVVTYNVSDAAGNAANEITRNVIVSEPVNGCTGGINSFPYSEGFENTLGAWSQSTADDINWTVDANGTPSNNTGPSNAFQGSYYVYVEASSPNFPSKRAILNSPCFDLSGMSEATFSFKYHMYGSNDMGTIDLEISTDEGNTWTSIWNQSGNKGNSWQTANVDISAYTGGGVQLRLNRNVGGTWQADIAIDDVELTEGVVVVDGCSGGITAYPYSEGFENTIGAWSQSTADDINWTVDANGTPSNNTGPSNAVEGTYYIYVEASGNGTGYPNKQAIITSPCYDLSEQSSANFSFDYHMYGSNDMGTIALEVSEDDGLSWNSIWSASGNKGNSWQSENVDLASYLGASIQLRFNRVTGGTWQADIAIDNINLTSTASVKETVNETIVVSSLDAAFVKVYPNPVKNHYLHVDTNMNNVSFVIYNTLGQTVDKGVLEENKIDVSELDAAVYQIQFIGSTKTITKRFIKE